MARALGNDPRDQWLEPCIGSGALLQALSKIGVSKRQILGLDLDERPQPADTLATVQRGIEFLSWSRSTDRRFHKIIANPPYVALERVQKAIQNVVERLETLDGSTIGMSGNLWYAFLCAAIRLLRPEGSFCFLLPASWEFANYAAPLRENIARYFSSVDIYRSSSPLFRAEQIQDGAVVVLARKFNYPPISKSTGSMSISRHEHADLDSLVAALGRAKHHSGRGTLPRNSFLPRLAPVNRVERIKFSDVVSVRLGAVTGDAQYFLLTDEQRRNFGLPVASLRPVVSRAKHLNSAEMTKCQWDALRKEGKRVWLFDPPPSALQHPAVAKYIALGKSQRWCNLAGHKISNRPIWYRSPMPGRIDGFLSGMSNLGPWICFRRMKGLAANNTLYVVRFRASMSENERANVALALLTSEVTDQLQLVGRRYADGLLKFEPGDLRGIQVPAPNGRRGALSAYKLAISRLVAGDRLGARTIADNWISAQQ